MERAVEPFKINESGAYMFKIQWPMVSLKRHKAKISDLSIRLVAAGKGRIKDNKASYSRIELLQDNIDIKIIEIRKLRGRATNLKTKKDQIEDDLQDAVSLSRVRQGALAKANNRIVALEKTQIDLKLQNALYASMVDDVNALAEESEKERLEAKEENKKIRVELKNKITAMNDAGNKRNKKMKAQEQEIKRLINVLERIR